MPSDLYPALHPEKGGGAGRNDQGGKTTWGEMTRGGNGFGAKRPETILRTPNEYLLSVTQKKGPSLKAALIVQSYQVDIFSAFDVFSSNCMLWYAPLISTSNPPRKQGLFLKEEKTKPWSECILSIEDRQFLKDLLNTSAYCNRSGRSHLYHAYCRMRAHLLCSMLLV